MNQSRNWCSFSSLIEKGGKNKNKISMKGLLGEEGEGKVNWDFFCFCFLGSFFIHIHTYKRDQRECWRWGHCVHRMIECWDGHFHTERTAFTLMPLLLCNMVSSPFEYNFLSLPCLTSSQWSRSLLEFTDSESIICEDHACNEVSTL